MRIKVFFVFLFFIASVCVFSQQDQQDWFTGKPIADIKFSGIKNISLSELEALVFPYKGRVYDEYLYTEILTKLFALNYFIHIDVATQRADGGSKVTLVFTVTEFPVVSRINFTGNSSVRRGELSDVISTKTSNFHNPVKVRADVEAIKNKYVEKGFPNANVSVTETPSGDSSIVLTFVINEGNKITIKSIEFQGNAKFSNATLRGQISLKAKTLLKDGAFQEAKLLEDIEALKKYYHDRGFIDADVKDVTRTFENDDKGAQMTLTFMIEEGNMFTFNGVTFNGNIIFTTAQLEKLIYSRKGEIINYTKIMTDLQRVSDLYYENGYIFNLIERTAQKNEQDNTVSYKVSIVERGRAYIEDIIVLGNEKTKTEVILREIPLEPGDVFSKTKVMEAWRNLMNLQYFTMVIPETPPGSTESLMDLVFNVEEQPTTDIQLGMTFSGISEPGQVPLSLMAKWTDRNFLGYGNMLGAELNLAWLTQSASIDYTHRWLFGLPLSASFDFTFQHTRRFAALNNNAPFFNGDEDYAFPDGFASYDEYNNANRVPPTDFLMEYNQWRLSLGVSTGYRFSTFLGNLGIGGGVRTGIVMNSYDDGIYRAFDPVIRERNNMWTPSNSLWSSLSLDQRDLFYDPSRGYYVVQRAGIYGILPMELEHYIRTDTKAEYFHTLLNIPITENYRLRFILGLHTGLSFIFPQPGWSSPQIENVNRLAIDGMFVGRGWNGEYHVKGLALWENWIELRIPFVPGILAYDFFFDAAAVKPTPSSLFNDFSIEDMRFSLGGQFRFTIPQFPIRLGLAKRFKVVNGAVEWQKGNIWDAVDLVFSFSISTY